MRASVMSCYAVSAQGIYHALNHFSLFWYASFQFMNYDITMFVDVNNFIDSDLSMIWLLTPTSWIERRSVEHYQLGVYCFENLGIELVRVILVICQIRIRYPIKVQDFFFFCLFCLVEIRQSFVECL